jgi:hypothetical protein
MEPMTTTVEALVLDLLEWLVLRERSYQETMEAWRTSCPRLPVWEEATDLGLISFDSAPDGSRVSATAAGRAFLRQHRASTR